MRVWSVERKQQQFGDAIIPIDIIKTPDDTLIFVMVYGPDDEGRAQFIVSACNAAEQRAEEERRQAAHDQAWLAMTPTERDAHMHGHEQTVLDAATRMALNGTIAPNVDKE